MTFFGGVYWRRTANSQVLTKRLGRTKSAESGLVILVRLLFFWEWSNAHLHNTNCRVSFSTTKNVISLQFHAMNKSKLIVLPMKSSIARRRKWYLAGCGTKGIYSSLTSSGILANLLVSMFIITQVLQAYGDPTTWISYFDYIKPAKKSLWFHKVMK